MPVIHQKVRTSLRGGGDPPKLHHLKPTRRRFARKRIGKGVGGRGLSRRGLEVMSEVTAAGRTDSETQGQQRDPTRGQKPERIMPTSTSHVISRRGSDGGRRHRTVMGEETQRGAREEGID